MTKLSPATKYLLEAFIPYTKANLKLVYKPSAFFDEHEKLSRTKQQTLKSAYYRAIKKGLLEVDNHGVPRLTAKGERVIKIYKPAKLPPEACLLVVFDIKEAERFKRNHLRALLRELSFNKVQQSVWMSRYDHREYLAMELKEYGLENSVIVYEALQLSLVKLK